MLQYKRPGATSMFIGRCFKDHFTKITLMEMNAKYADAVEARRSQ